MTDWNASQYIKFKTQRTQPSIDLINRLQHLNPANILDIGCGPGNSTHALQNQFKNADITGIDSSENMLGKASASYPELNFFKCTVPEDLKNLKKSFDLVFSNACIHWIPDQKKLIHNIFQIMEGGGVLAVQIPLIQEAPFYKILYTLINTPPWHDKLSYIHNFYNLLPEEYYDLLSKLNCSFDIWQTVYYHPMESLNEIFEWYKGSGLRPYLNVLNPEEQQLFRKDILQCLNQYYAIQKNGKILLKMPRLFFTAVKL